MPAVHFPLQPTAVGKNLFCSAQDGSSGRELWRTDGTPVGTIRLKDIYLGGNDVITGGLGGDTFRFATALSGSGNRDQLTDFTPGQGDRIELENGIFTALPSTGPLAAAAFTIGSGATTAAHRIIYNAGTGSLSYDSNGSAAGGATVFAMLDPNLLLSHSMFTVT